MKEPPRLAPAADAVQPPKHAPLGRRVLTFMELDALKAISAKPKVYYPLFGALALSAVDSFGLAFWRTPFMVRTYGWNEAQVGMALGPIMLVGSIAGLMFGIGGAVPQNAAVQRVAPNAMRGQVTAFYLFMFTFLAPRAASSSAACRTMWCTTTSSCGRRW